MTTDGCLGRVMLVDDEEVDQMLCRRILKRSRMATEVLGFTYAEEALDYLTRPGRDRVDLILLDINMPRMTGLEFLAAATEALGARFEPAVILMLTTSLNTYDRARASRFDVIMAHVEKPLGAKHLLSAAQILTERRAAN